MTCYCIYLGDDTYGNFENVGTFPTEELAIVVANTLHDLIKRGNLFFTYNNSQEPFENVEVIEYSDNGSKTVYKLPEE